MSTEWLNLNSNRTYPFVDGSNSLFKNDQILDISLSGCRSYFGNFEGNVDYDVSRVVRDSFFTKIYVRELFREILDINDPLTYREVGFFKVENVNFGISQFKLTPINDSEVNGVITCSDKIVSGWATGQNNFSFYSCEIISSLCSPKDGSGIVRTLSSSSSPDKLSKNVKIMEGSNISIRSSKSYNGLIFEFSEENEPCENENSCVEDGLCDAALMTISGVGPDHRYNVSLVGDNSIQVSAITNVKIGGNPFNPADYYVSGIMITYGGMVTFDFSGGDASDPKNWNYGLDCKTTEKAKKIGTIENNLATLETDIDQLGKDITNIP